MFYTKASIDEMMAKLEEKQEAEMEQVRITMSQLDDIMIQSNEESEVDLKKSHDELETMHTEVDNAVQNMFEHIDKMSKHQKTIDDNLKELLVHKERKEANEPWIEVLGGDIDAEKGLQLNLDWNDAFIDQLRAQGYTGSSDSSLIGKYLLTLSEMVGSKQDNV